MKTAKNSRKKIITKAFNRRISAVLAFILLFQTIFSGVEVRAEQAVSSSQGAAIGQTADAGQADTSTMVPAGSLQGGTPSVSTSTDSSITQQDVPVPYPSGGYTLTIDKSGAWGGYAQYAVTITNTGKATLEDIALALPWQDAEVDAIWCATATKQNGTIYILPLEWCENLAPGASLAFGFIVKGDDDKLIPPEKHALITSEQVTAIQNGTMQPPVWEELQTPGPENTSEPATPSPQPAPTHTTEVEQTPAPTNTPYPTSAPTAEPTTAPTPEPTPTPTATPTAEPSPGPLPTTEPTAVPTPEPAPTAEPTATPAPTTAPYLTTGITGTEPAAYGYTTPPAIQIQVTNIGQGTSLPFTLSLPDESAPFTILPPETNILAGGERTTITVQVSTGLDAGLYTGTLILHVPGQPDTVIPLLQQIHKAAVLEPAEIRIAAITTDTITLAEISGYEYNINQEQNQAGEFQDSPVFTGLQPDTEYTLFMRKKEDKNHTAGQITTAQVRTGALPEAEHTPAPAPTETPGPATTPTAESTATPTALPTAVPSAKPTSVPAPTPEPCEDLYVDGSLTLTEPTTCRNLYMNGTRLDPNGYKLTVTGNIIQHSGTILGGTTENPLLVKGNYTQDGGMLSLVRGRHARILGNYTQEGASECRMRYDSGCLLDIRGNWTINTEEWNLLETGTIRLGGNLTQTSESSQNSLDMETAMNLILDGTAPQTVETAHGENSYLANLDLTQAHRVKFTKYLRARSLRGLGSIHNQGDLQLKITQLTLAQDETVHDDLVLLGGEIRTNGHTLTLEKNLTIKGGWLEASGEASCIKTGGSFTQAGGTLAILYGAQAHILGNYTMDGAAECRMRYDSGCLLDIRGDWAIHTEGYNIFETGTIRLGGNLNQTGNSHEQSLDMETAMNLILDGTAPQTVETAHGENSYLANLDLTQAHRVKFTKYIRARSLRGLEHIHNQGDLQLKITQLTLTQDETVHDGLVLLGGEIRTNGHTLTLEKNLAIKGGWLEASGETSCIKIDGNLTQEAGTLVILYGAHAYITGNYTMNGTAECRMRYHSGCLLDIRGNWTISTEGYNILENGTIKLGGNLTQTSGSAKDSLQLHKYMNVFLDGTRPQTVQTAHEETSYLAKLDLTHADAVTIPEELYVTTIDGLSRITNTDELILHVNTLTPTRDETLPCDLILDGGDLRLYEHVLTVNGSLETWNADITIDNGGKLTVQDSINHDRGTLRLHEGTISAGGSYYLDDTYFETDHADSLIIIGNNLTLAGSDTRYTNFRQGKMRLGGNLTQKNSAHGSLTMSSLFHLYLEGNTRQNIQIADETGHSLGSLYLYSAKEVLFHQPVRACYIDDISCLSPDKSVKIYAEQFIGVGSGKPVQPQITLCQGGIHAYHGMATFLKNLTIQRGYIAGDVHCEKNLSVAKGSINTQEMHVEGNLVLTDTAMIKLKEKARLQVDGDFTYKSTTTSVLESGTCIFGGNIRVNAPKTAKTLIEQSDVCHVYLKGTNIQNIHMEDEALWEIRRLHLETSTGVIIHDPLRVHHLTGWDKILGNLTLGECDVQLKQDETLHGNLSLNHTILEPLGHSLQTQGNIQVMDSTIHVQASEITIDGNLTIDGNSLFQMEHNDDNVTVYGDFIMRSERRHYGILDTGTLHLFGDFHQSGSKYSFAARDKHKTYFHDIEGQEKVHQVYFEEALESGFNNSDYANGCKLNHIAEPKNALEAAEIFTLGFAESLNIIEHATDAILMLGEIVEQDAELLRTDPQAFALSMLAKVGVSLENMNVTIQGINTFLLVKDTIMYYVGSNASLAEKISSGGEATGTLVITLIALGADLASLDKEGIATLMEGIKTGDLSAATLARACGDTKQMAKAAQTFFQKEAAEQIADMSVSQARYLLKTGEQAYKAAGGTIRLGKTEILKLLDNFADDIAADIAAETLAAQLGRTRTMEAIESVLDKTTFEAIKDTIEGRGLEQAELEKLNQVIRGYSLQKGEQMSTTQIRGLLKDGSWLTKSVDDVVAELQGLSQNRIDFYVNKVTKYSDSDTVILGVKGNYNTIGESNAYTYFNISDELWESLKKETTNNNDEIWKVNKQFIDEQITADKRILLSDNPYKKYYDDNGKRFYQRELDYLKSLGYSFEVVDNKLWCAKR